MEEIEEFFLFLEEMDNFVLFFIEQVEELGFKLGTLRWEAMVDFFREP